MYVEQCQFSIWVTGFDAWVFANYDHRMKVSSKKLHHVLIERDQKYMDKYDNASVQFIKDMDLMLEKSGVEFKSQWDN
jgi:exodeoxyribonuclease (lambda-induced)